MKLYLYTVNGNEFKGTMEIIEGKEFLKYTAPNGKTYKSTFQANDFGGSWLAMWLGNGDRNAIYGIEG